MGCDHPVKSRFEAGIPLDMLATTPQNRHPEPRVDRQARIRQALAALMQDRAVAAAVARSVEDQARQRAKAAGPHWTRPWFAAQATGRRTVQAG